MNELYADFPLWQNGSNAGRKSFAARVGLSLFDRLAVQPVQCESASRPRSAKRESANAKRLAASGDGSKVPGLNFGKGGLEDDVQRDVRGCSSRPLTFEPMVFDGWVRNTGRDPRCCRRCYGLRIWLLVW